MGIDDSVKDNIFLGIGKLMGIYSNDPLRINFLCGISAPEYNTHNSVKVLVTTQSRF